jgi:hypothetical protein
MQKLILSVLPCVTLATKQETATMDLPHGVPTIAESEIFNEVTGEWESAVTEVEDVKVGGDWESMGYYDENGEWVFGVEPEHEDMDWEAYAYGDEEDEGSDLNYEDVEALVSLIFEDVNDALEYHAGDLHAMHDIYRISDGWALLPLETNLDLLHEAIDSSFPN